MQNHKISITVNPLSITVFYSLCVRDYLYKAFSIHPSEMSLKLDEMNLQRRNTYNKMVVCCVQQITS